ncbi:MAG: LptA/OstA family protein [Ahrensia sp.]
MTNRLFSFRTSALLVAAMLASGLTAAPHAQAQSFGGADGLALSSDEPVQIEGDRLEMRETEGLAVFDGNVSVVQGETVLRTGRLVIHYDTSGGAEAVGTGQAAIERLEVSGGVNIQTGPQVATGDQGTYDMRSEVLVLTGKRVTLSEGGNVATGCKLTVTMANSRAKLEGCGNTASRPKVLIQPRSLNRN